MEYDWDETKNRANEAKHGFSFEEASQLFESGIDYIEIFDAEHSLEEERFIAIGPISRGVIAVVWTEVKDAVVRIISARRATRREARAYENRMKGKR